MTKQPLLYYSVPCNSCLSAASISLQDATATAVWCCHLSAWSLLIAHLLSSASTSGFILHSPRHRRRAERGRVGGEGGVGGGVEEGAVVIWATQSSKFSRPVFNHVGWTQSIHKPLIQLSLTLMPFSNVCVCVFFNASRLELWNLPELEFHRCCFGLDLNPI